jgi:hypothetical protein
MAKGERATLRASLASEQVLLRALMGALIHRTARESRDAEVALAEMEADARRLVAALAIPGAAEDEVAAAKARADGTVRLLFAELRRMGEGE